MEKIKINQVYQNYALALLFLFPLFFLSRGSIVYRINLFEYPSLLSFFKVFNFLGDGWMCMIIFFFLLIYRKVKKVKEFHKEIFSYLISVLLMFIFVSILKQGIYPMAARPIAFFENIPSYWNPEEFKIVFHQRRSFPSGHTATAATLGFFMMRFCTTKFLRMGLFSLILLAGFSRVFLFQHFIQDVIAGLFIGLFCVGVVNQISFFMKKRLMKKKDILFQKSLAKQ